MFKCSNPYHHIYPKFAFSPQMAYKMPDYPAYTVIKETKKAAKTKDENKEGSANMGFQEN